MKKKTLLLVTAIMVGLTMLSDNAVIKYQGFFKYPVRDSAALLPDSLDFPADAEEIRLPAFGMYESFKKYGFNNLKKVCFGDVDYLEGGLFMDDSTIEEIEFDGLVGHFDCAMVINCPNLRKIVFHGPVNSTGGSQIAYNCPQLDSVIFESAVVDFSLGISPVQHCPKLTEYTNRGAFIDVYNDSLTPRATIDQLRSNVKLTSDLERIANWQIEVLTAKNSGLMRMVAYQSAQKLLPVLEQLNSDKAIHLKKAMEYAKTMGDDLKSNLEVLKESPKYAPDTVTKPDFEYALPSDSLLRLSRERFNLDSIAGNGDDINRIKNLMYWVHDNIPHNGSNGLAPGPRNLRNTYDSAHRDSCGYNCRALAICLTEALLAEGIPARYLTCEPKRWDSDPDCHVICVAWSGSLNKWIWVDPTFAAFVTDENGLPLHPGEVRRRLQNDMPLILNEDANWNHRSMQTKEGYLEDYMAKNLYIISANMLNQAEPEGETNHKTGAFAALVPLDSDYTSARIITTDDTWFWQPPK